VPNLRGAPRCSGVHGHRPGLAMSWMTRGARSRDAPHSVTERRSALGDAFVDSWVAWREATEDVRTAYRWWSECARPQRALAFAGYRAALDREQHAANIHSDWAERIRAVGR
jgi:hypothetical protein